MAKLTGAVCDPSYGLDHGAWVPAMLGWPEADIPIFQLAVQPYMTPAHHIALGRKLAPLREEGILVMGTGSATHNLRRLMRGQHGASPSRGPWHSTTGWPRRSRRATSRRSSNYRTEAPHARVAHPTDEHFLPLYVAFGAGRQGAKGKPLHRSFTPGNLRWPPMRSLRTVIGARVPDQDLADRRPIRMAYAAWARLTPFSFNSCFSSPVSNISRMMSQPPMNSPLT